MQYSYYQPKQQPLPTKSPLFYCSAQHYRVWDIFLACLGQLCLSGPRAPPAPHWAAKSWKHFALVQVLLSND